MQEWMQQMQKPQQTQYIDHFTIAMAYVPWQTNCNMYENLDEAYKAGTIFPPLYKPFVGRRRCNECKQ